jgi:signal transduction histidine kinase
MTMRCTLLRRMNRKEALAQLSSDDVTIRLAAANALSRLAKPADLAPLIAARDREGSPWVLHTLERVIASLGGESSNAVVREPEETSPKTALDLRDLESRIVYQITEMVVHELSPIVGRIQVRATEEIPECSRSKTWEEISRLQLLTTGLHHLATAAGTPTLVDIELGPVVREITERALSPFGVTVDDVASFAGPPLRVATDPALLDLIIGNAVRNGYEAVVDTGAEVLGSLVITWGATHTVNWIAVRDSGPGLSEPAEKLFSAEFSTKGHMGFGLLITKFAARSLSGEVELRNAAGGGAVFKLDWRRR